MQSRTSPPKIGKIVATISEKNEKKKKEFPKISHFRRSEMRSSDLARMAAIYAGWCRDNYNCEGTIQSALTGEHCCF